MSGFVNKSKLNHLCWFHKAIYGLKQALRAWYTEFKTFLLSCGFLNSSSDASLFIYNQGSIVAYFLVYVDDLLVTGNNSMFVKEFLQALSNKFSVKDLGSLNFFFFWELKQYPQYMGYFSLNIGMYVIFLTAITL